MTWSNHSVEANRRPAAPLEAGKRFGSPGSAPPELPAAIAHLWRSALAGTVGSQRWCQFERLPENR